MVVLSTLPAHRSTFSAAKDLKPGEQRTVLLRRGHGRHRVTTRAYSKVLPSLGAVRGLAPAKLLCVLVLVCVKVGEKEAIFVPRPLARRGNTVLNKVGRGVLAVLVAERGRKLAGVVGGRRLRRRRSQEPEWEENEGENPVQEAQRRPNGGIDRPGGHADEGCQETGRLAGFFGSAGSRGRFLPA